MVRHCPCSPRPPRCYCCYRDRVRRCRPGPSPPVAWLGCPMGMCYSGVGRCCYWVIKSSTDNEPTGGRRQQARHHPTHNPSAAAPPSISSPFASSRQPCPHAHIHVPVRCTARPPTSRPALSNKMSLPPRSNRSTDQPTPSTARPPHTDTQTMPSSSSPAPARARPPVRCAPSKATPASTSPSGKCGTVQDFHVCTCVYYLMASLHVRTSPPAETYLVGGSMLSSRDPRTRKREGNRKMRTPLRTKTKSISVTSNRPLRCFAFCGSSFAVIRVLLMRAVYENAVPHA